MLSTPLSRLSPVDLRTIWRSESTDFTPWLAKEENLSLLAQAIGLELELESTEATVGSFYADILCKNSATGRRVVIENQLEKTDHDHLGKLLTYAAALNAETVVWVAQRFTDEHRAAIDWLNQFAGNAVRFFAVELELWRIEDSPVAPKFNIVSKPNDWVEAVVDRADQLSLSPTKRLQLDFWTDFADYANGHGARFHPTKPQPETWMSIALGTSGVELHATATTAPNNNKERPHQLRAGVAITGSSAAADFSFLKERQSQVESRLNPLNLSLDWRPSQSGKEFRIETTRAVDLNARDLWPGYYTWLADALNALHEVFAPLARSARSQSRGNATEG